MALCFFVLTQFNLADSIPIGQLIQLAGFNWEIG